MSHESGNKHTPPLLDTIQGAVEVNYDSVDMPSWFKEPGEEYGYRPWQHTPLKPYNDPVRSHQQALYKAFERLATEPIPPDTHPRIAHLVHIDFMSGNVRRQAHSQANYEGWRASHPHEYEALKADDELEWLLGEAKMGHANPASLLKLLAAAPSLPSLDLQVLTTPFGYRRHNMPAMERELIDCVKSVGGVIFDEPALTHEPKIAVHDLGDGSGDRGLIITQKYMIGGYTADPFDNDLIYIMERQAYVMHASKQTGFPDHIMKLLNTVSTKDERFREVADFIAERIASNEAVIPTSTMVYAHRNIPEQEKPQVEYSPALAEARREARDAELAKLAIQSELGS